MRNIKALVAGAAVAATAAAMAVVAVAPASADPINSKGKTVTPAPYDVVAVGSESIFAVTDQLSFNFNKSVGKRHSPSHPYFYSWDAVNPKTPNDTNPENVILKKGCAKAVRPNGSSAGIAALSGYPTVKFHGKTYQCVDFARSSRPRKSTDPAAGTKGGVLFVALAGDAVTYASTNLKGEKTNVPNNLTQAQLTEIFGCTVAAAHGFKANTWGALLGSKAKGAKQAIDPIGPQAGSGTLSFWFETALGLTTDTEPTCGTAASLPVAQQPEENEGVNKIFGSKAHPNQNAIFPFSVGSYVAQQYHSGTCGKKPGKGKNQFGCNQIGVLGLNGIKPTGFKKAIAPTVKSGKAAVTNPAWTGTVFHRTLFDVVRWTKTTKTHIPASLGTWLGRNKYFCKQSSVLKAYGFEPLGNGPLGCGSTS